MIQCPNCKQEQLEGSFFCSECGTQIVPVDRMSTQSIRRDSTSFLRSTPVPAYPDEARAAATEPRELEITLNLVDSGRVIRLNGQGRRTLGREVEGQITFPDIDLTPYGAFNAGVSRIHAALQVAGQRVTIIDLGSSNGTRVNGRKINTNTELLLNHGDMIALGKLKIQFLVRK